MSEPLFQRLTREHRELDALFGHFLAAAQGGDTPAAAEAIEVFDEELRRHTALEEEQLYPAPPGGKLAEPGGEEPAARLSRELRLEHVQIREVSGMIRRFLAEGKELEGARRLAGNLARRWEAHTVREEAEVFGSAR